MSSAKATPDKILLHGDDTSRWVIDGVANAAITPGEVLEVAGIDSTGIEDNPQVQPHATAAGPAKPRVALEYGKTGNTIDNDYAAGDHVEYHVFKPGEIFYGLLAAGAAVTPDDPVESAGNGALQAHDGTTFDLGGTGTVTVSDGIVVGTALEAVDNTAGTEPVRVRVEAN